LTSARLSRELFVLEARSLPERQALAYDATRPHALDTSISVVLKHPELPVADIYQEAVRSRALVADEMARRQRNLNASNDAETARLLTDLDQARNDLLAAEHSAPSQGSDADRVQAANIKMEAIERSLAEHSSAMRADERIDQVTTDDVRHNLPAQSVLISYFEYRRCVVDAVDPAAAEALSYMAFVVHPESDQIRIFSLGDAASLDGLVLKARAAAEAESHSGGLGSIRNERAYREAALSIRQRIWDPLNIEIGKAKLALVVGDGNLNLIPFASLPDGGGYLVEHGPVIHTLSSERDLVPTIQGQRKQGLLAIGSPSFNLAENKLPPSPLRGATPTCEEFSRIEFQPLPGTAAEVFDIASSWRKWNAAEPAHLVTGDDATLASFLTGAAENRVLHVATHAFLLDKNCGSGNPLLHSGLVFTGGSRGATQSILTAQQIASPDLGGVDWAVLSACNTGNGELRDGEGVLGLQRAFRVAGAHSVIMTLWAVDDDAAHQFMHELYAERLSAHATTADAVWDSSRKLLLQRRAAGKTTHPWYWAGFVGSGRWE
jgi:CHAT domain-containing protein